MEFLSAKIEELVNDYGREMAEFFGDTHRDCDTVFRGFYVETDRDGDEYVTALYYISSDETIGVQYFEGGWIVEDTLLEPNR